MSLSNGGQKSVNDILDLARVNFISNVSAVFRRGLFGELPEWIFDVATYDYAIHMLECPIWRNLLHESMHGRVQEAWESSLEPVGSRKAVSHGNGGTQ